MSKKVGAILLDTRSIQKYVFSCNKLKTNVGASYLVDAIFNDLMQAIILPSFNLKMPEEAWQKTEGIQMLNSNEIECEIVYIGGGNMLILINKYPDNMKDNLKLCREIVGRWSEEMLKKTPGLKTGAAIGEMDINDFKNSLDDMYKQLKANQNTVLPQVDLPYTGLTLECNISGKVADIYDRSVKIGERGKERNRWISKEVKSKKDAYKLAAKRVKKEYLEEKYNDKYDFVIDLDNIGCKESESYISVIHIDGNNMGIKFGNCRTSQERKQLSLAVANRVKEAFKSLIELIVNEYNNGVYTNVLDMDKLIDDEGRKLLPIRPIIIGGDDITFVCPGRLGIEYAKRFIEFVSAKELLSEEQYKHMKKASGKEINRKLSCCGGVAIIPRKYPFFRAYQLAESLCSSAKSKSRENDKCYIDFAILYGEMTPTLEQLKHYQYKGAIGDLHYGPYRVKEKDENLILEDKSGIDDLLALKNKLADKRVSANKVKELRDVLTKDMHSIMRFLENSSYKAKDEKITISDIVKAETGKKQVEAKDFWQKKDGETELKTRYIDAIEIIDFTLPKTEG